MLFKVTFFTGPDYSRKSRTQDQRIDFKQFYWLNIFENSSAKKFHSIELLKIDTPICRPAFPAMVWIHPHKMNVLSFYAVIPYPHVMRYTAHAYF